MESRGDTARAAENPWLVFSSVVLAAWAYSTATTIGNAVLPQMQGDLSASLDQVTWVITASVVAGAIGIPPTPWLAARFGLKRLLVGSLVVFTLSSAMIGVAGSLGEIIFWRICQAFFGAPIMVLSQTVTLAAFPYERRGTVMAIWSVSLTTGWVFGPAIGAYLADWHSWRLSFFILAPASMLATIACAICIRRAGDEKRLRFDWTGFIALSVVLLATQIVFNRGQREDWLESEEILGWIILAMICLIVYVAHTLTSKSRFIRWGVLADRNFSLGLLLSCVFAVISLAPLVLIPPMLEELKGLDVITIGLLVAPRGVTQIVFMLALGPFVARLDPRVLCSIGFTCFAASNWMISSYNLDIGLWDVFVPQLLQGASVAFIWLPIFHMLYATLDEQYHTDAATLIGLTYNVVSSAALALLVALLNRHLQINTEELGANITPTNELLRFPEYSTFDLEDLESLAAIQAEVAQQALMIGYANLFWLLTWVSLAALPMLLLIPFRRRQAMTVDTHRP